MAAVLLKMKEDGEVRFKCLFESTCFTPFGRLEFVLHTSLEVRVKKLAMSDFHQLGEFAVASSGLRFGTLVHVSLI